MALDENDFLTYQLFTASRTPRVKNGRIRAWGITTGCFACLALLFFQSNNEFLGYYFLAATALCATLYPFYSRWKYKKHYLKYIRDTYKNRFGEECDLEIKADSILTRDRSGESTINISEIEEINEIRDHCFVKFRTGVALIISKSKTKDIDTIISDLKGIATRLGIQYNDQPDWRWR
jgi:hypothetical protein